ncbi:DUF3427 domain-containing protein [Pseudomonas sp. DTU_2021_1001937_2_SI_NGA_ILE_001]|uniref:HNH endonuclease n=1 Tax=Pseudomonas sp. DTU_2021_1001937_2_SI_NGA_ILE_001 TaxID=3077589 RepID=UPI0028FC26BF|nr:HNH endonuclease [Pseudomonas sp. DTU_2021_1001937_2_SI_NGA_ILE_001]WNW13781.1 DUF3427 domain-containing protein [Pseudomonas sp. DTU_2021_1001937_2_SI_NGA_ILE_001]
MNANDLQDKPGSQYASAYLEVGKVYTRADLKSLFSITDATINTGIFKPAGLHSVWLFVTEHKTADRTQYQDLLDGDTLHMDGQSKGRTDKLIKEHLAEGLELLLFYRKAKYEYPGAGFVYEGPFQYQSHEGAAPTQFVLRRQNLLATTLGNIETHLQAQGEFDPSNIKDARARTLANIVRRKGQSTFRRKLLAAYSKRCAVTGCSVEALLEAAHIVPYLGAETNVVSNGLLLRADIHTLFDLGLLWIDPETLKVGLAGELTDSEYWLLNGKPALLPMKTVDRPSQKALTSHWNTLKNSELPS